MKNSDAAFAVAKIEIAKARAFGWQSLEFCFPQFEELRALPPEIAEQDQLRSLDIHNCRVADITCIGELTRLQSVGLGWLPVKDHSALANLRALNELWICGTFFDDVNVLAPLERLESLSLQELDISDVSVVSNMKSLKRLSLNDTLICDLEPVRSLTSLTSLDVRGTRVADLAPLARLARLERLWIRRSDVEDLSPLRDMTELRLLDISGTPVWDLRPILGLRNLFFRPDTDREWYGLWLEGCTAALLDPKLGALADIEDPVDRGARLYAYLTDLFS